MSRKNLYVLATLVIIGFVAFFAFKFLEKQKALRTSATIQKEFVLPGKPVPQFPGEFIAPKSKIEQSFVIRYPAAVESSVEYTTDLSVAEVKNFYSKVLFQKGYEVKANDFASFMMLDASQMIMPLTLSVAIKNISPVEVIATFLDRRSHEN